MKTLMATDGSPEATAALTAASRFLRKQKNAVSVLCVAPEPPIKLSANGSRNGQERIRDAYRKRIGKETQAIVSAGQAALLQEGIESEPITQFGSPAGIIQQLTGDYDVTVVGATGRRDRSLIGIGPVAGRTG